MTTVTNFGRDLYLRNTDFTGRNTVSAHRVWDADLSMSARRAEAAKGAAEDARAGRPAKQRVEQITAAQYLTESQA